eukprot:CAMPEP_0201739584 /NCGR_PEP_ID=MMETSP0593-20130828/45856_1 /ASSEMBLY_ACC=CAM_ASM_000672 /TAXON_ID=267983 /ORGANISM="Skeletonema japonicum, Strain CCMP2506" /LENGTH=413 /DNA_ID=CAMNT_0048233863 /DNA_START=110 /DNA_END=1351 /DNA_ORIENTATION=+
MKSNFLLPLVVVSVLIAAAVASDDCTSSYTQLPHGQTPYSNDGGCFFCGRFKGSTFPISDLGELSLNCQQMCDNDPTCTAYTIAREAALHAHEYYWGAAANCCLEREEYPPETFIDAQNGGDEPNTCEKESMCWTRYEKDAGSSCDKKQKKSKQRKSKLCEPIWKARKFSDKKKKKHKSFIKNGCPYKSKKFVSMLDEAYQQCKAEVEADPQQPQIVQQKAQQASFHNIGGKRSAWVAHGVFGLIAFGILAPLSAFGSSFPSLIPTEAYTAIHVTTFVLAFITVFVALKSKKELVDDDVSGLEENHQLVGLALLLLVCLQTLGWMHRDQKSDLAHKLITGAGLVAFGFGAYEITSGCSLFAKHYGTADWGQVYLGYICWLMLMVVGGKLAMKYRGGNTRIEYAQVQSKAFELT